MNYLQAILLGLLQAATEFFPVSSCGHLALAERLLGIKPELSFVIWAHLGTVFAICWVFHNDLLKIFRVAIAWKHSNGKEEDRARRIIITIAVATIITVFFGLIVRDYVERLFCYPKIICIMLICTGVILCMSHFIVKTKRSISSSRFVDGLVIGLFQSFALIPGISRSGNTIFAALLLGIDRKEAVEISFLVAMPAILGATFLEILENYNSFFHNMTLNLVGAVTAAFAGIVILNILIKIVIRKHLIWFAPYLFFIGIIGLFFF
ncbi:MAG: undecaprenyl-diphosphate phosphatase [Candidatus Theseobacter exili]|nr:undecaprenyl-diphosphate phosphatase [Candidatus Theseobacter exili]